MKMYSCMYTCKQGFSKSLPQADAHYRKGC